MSPRRRGQSSSTQPCGRATITGNRRPSPRLVTGASKGQEQADRLAPGHTRGRVRGHGKTLPRDRGARGSEVPLLRGNQRRHPARTHLSRSWSASEPASTTSPRNLRHFEAARNSTPSRERRTVHWGKEPEDEYRHQARKSSRRSNLEYRDKSVCWTSPMQTRKHRYTCEEAVLITMNQLPLPPRRASVNTTLVRDMCPSTNGAINLSPWRWKALGASG